MAEPHEEDQSWLAPFFSDPALAPVRWTLLLVLLTLLAATLILALAERNLYAMAALAILLVMSVDAGVRQWRSGQRRLAWLLAGLWAGASLGAFGALRAGLF